MDGPLTPGFADLSGAMVQLQARIGRLLVGLGVDAQLVGDQPLKAGCVHRQLWRARDKSRTFVIKRFSAERSCVERLSVERWLPLLGLADVAPSLLAVVAGADGRFVWHVYEDLGDGTLDAGDPPGGPTVRDRGHLSAMRADPEPERLRGAVAGLARLHQASIDHSMLGECRYWGGDLGGHFLSASVRDAIRALEALELQRVPLSEAHRATRDALLAAMWRLKDEERDRRAQLAAFGGPECLLHGDFGVRNVLLLPTDAGWAGRLIDWDHAGVGPASYDLSTFLAQLAPATRAGALELYRSYRDGADADWPDDETWDGLFDTAERSRLANSVIWPALSAIDGEGASAFDDLSAIADWFEALRPVLRDPAAPASGGRST